MSVWRNAASPGQGEETPERETPSSSLMAAQEISLFLLILGGVAVAYAMPFKAVKYGVIGFFAVVMILQTMRRPAVGLAMLLFATPALDLIPPSLFPLRGLNAETILVLAGLFIWHRASVLYGRDTLRSSLGKFLAVYALLVILSAVRAWMIWKLSLFDVLSAAKNHLSFMVFLPVALHTLRDRRDQYLVLVACSLSLLLNCFQAMNYSMVAFLAGSLERHRAMALLALQPNTLGAALAMYLPILAMLALHGSESRAGRLWFLLCSGACGFALLLTLSRGAWMGLAAGLLAAGILRSRKLLVVMLLLGATYQFWVPQQAVDRVKVTSDLDEDALAEGALMENSAQMRIEQYKSLPNMMAGNPLLGWGYKSFPMVFEKYGTLQRSKGAHSSYCQLGAEGGIVGLAALLAVLGAMAWCGIRANFWAREPWQQWLGVGVFAATVSMAVSMITGARFEPQKIFAFFWAFAGIAEREGLLGLQAQVNEKWPFRIGGSAEKEQ